VIFLFERAATVLVCAICVALFASIRLFCDLLIVALAMMRVLANKALDAISL
jgi:hypothetical protein